LEEFECRILDVMNSLRSGPYRKPGAKPLAMRPMPGFLQRALSSFAVPDPEDFIDRRNENFSITDLSGSR
jgi:hypothetical protein